MIILYNKTKKESFGYYLGNTKAIPTPNETSNKADYFDPAYAVKYRYIFIIIIMLSFIINDNIMIY